MGRSDVLYKLAEITLMCDITGQFDERLLFLSNSGWSRSDASEWLMDHDAGVFGNDDAANVVVLMWLVVSSGRAELLGWEARGVL